MIARQALPEPGINPLRTLTDYRDLLHRAVTAVLVVLGTYQVHWAGAGSALVVLWIPAILGVVDASVSWLNSTDTGRKAIYAVLGLAQLIATAAGIATDTQAALITGVVIAVLNSVYASQWTATSPVSATTG